jgi:hypothetical protein
MSNSAFVPQTLAKLKTMNLTESQLIDLIKGQDDYQDDLFIGELGEKLKSFAVVN